MYIAGFLVSLLIGVSLGLIGGGGSILTVPALAYLFGVDAMLATTYSLFIVGSTSVVGSISYFKKGLVSLKTGFLFGIPSIIAVLLTRIYLVPAIPQQVLKRGAFILTKDMLLMLLFAILMILASFSMIKKGKGNDIQIAPANTPALIILAQGLGVGMVTGLIGAGGGFLIIPALVNMLKLPMKAAIGTSLFIIAINSLTGFFFSINNQPVQWPLLLSIASIAIAGILIGSFLSTRIDGKKLKPAFGWFVLIMGVYILIREAVLK
jgi:uncharacterized membrane protein YfcA